MTDKMTTPDHDDDVRKSVERIAESMGGRILSDEELAALLDQGERDALERDARARSDGRRFLSEETDGELIESWWADAKRCTSIDDAASLAHRLVNDYRHDYGTICHAVAAASYAMAKAMNASPVGHITGYQADAVQWLLLSHWNVWDDAPRRIVEYQNLLYPQYDYVFTTLPRSTADWLIDRAKTNLATVTYVHPNVIARWRDIAEGTFPSFVRIDEDREQ